MRLCIKLDFVKVVEIHLLAMARLQAVLVCAHTVVAYGTVIDWDCHVFMTYNSVSSTFEAYPF